MPTEKFTNNGASTLNGGINNAVTSLVVNSAASFPTQGQFRILIGTEIIIVGTVSGSTFSNLTRGAELTTAVSHLNGDAVTLILTAGSLSTLPRAMSATGDMEYLNSSGLPAALAAPGNGNYAVQFTGGVPSWNSIGNLGAVITGSIHAYGGSSAPSGYALCDGSPINRVTFAALFAIIGTTFGVGDGATTFNVPDLRGRSPMGSGTGTGLTTRVLGVNYGEQNHTLTIAELASHNHIQNAHAHALDGSGGNHYGDNNNGAQIASSNGTGAPQGVIDFQGAVSALQTATNQSTGSGTPHNVIHPVQAVNFIIKT